MARKSLPNIEPLPNMPQSASISQAATQTSIPSSIFSSVYGSSATCTPSTQTSAAMATVCSSVVTSTSHSAPKMVEVIVVNATNTSDNVPTVQKDNVTVVNSVGKPEYKLTEIVDKEKCQLFQCNTGVELEPPRNDVYTVRRRSRQFFTLREEEEEIDAEKAVASALETDVNGKTLHVDPVFNLGESLRRLYFPNEYRMSKKNKAKKEGEENKAESTTETKEDINIASDPAGCASLYQKISSIYGLRRVHSQPEFNNAEDATKSVDTFDFSTYSKSKSLPTTPKVSPKLLRKNFSQTTDEIPDKKAVTDANGPGLSFLASVAGNVRMYKAKQEKIRQEELKRREEKHAVARMDIDKTAVSSAGQLVERNCTQTVMAKSTAQPHSAQDVPDFNDNTVFRPRTYSNESDSDSEASFVKNIISWGTKKRVRMSSKEANMFSPTSF